MMGSAEAALTGISLQGAGGGGLRESTKGGDERSS